ncbi:MAG: hypothetical protein ACR2IA_02350 [Pyrinomonadaceae bacterium]
MSVQLEITTENLLNAVAQMPESEFDSFVEKARKLRQKGKKDSSKEADLLHKINTIYSAEKRQRYNELYAKFQTENISEKERNELLKLSDEFEVLNAERLKYIGELAGLRGKSLENVIRDLGIKTTQK